MTEKRGEDEFGALIDKIQASEYAWILQRAIGPKLGEIVLKGLVSDVADAVVDLRENVIELEGTVEELKKSAIDPVTKLPGRYYYNQEITAAYARLERDERDGFALVYFDMLNLKKINDTFGHKMGDRYLEGAAESIQDILRKGDMLFSVGGDEMAAILYGELTPENVDDLLGRAEQSFGQHVGRLKDMSADERWDDVQCGISAGYVIASADVGIEEMEQTADLRMYEHKRQMKNIDDDLSNNSL